jgi:hypothetical protein
MADETNVVFFPGVHSIEAPVDVIDEERALETAGLLGKLAFQYVMLPGEEHDDRRDQLFKQVGEACRAGGWPMAEFDRCVSAAVEAAHGWAEGMGRDFGR